jgi:hypothetical protein
MVIIDAPFIGTAPLLLRLVPLTGRRTLHALSHQEVRPPTQLTSRGGTIFFVRPNVPYELIGSVLGLLASTACPT